MKQKIVCMVMDYPLVYNDLGDACKYYLICSSSLAKKIVVSCVSVNLGTGFERGRNNYSGQY